MADHEPYGIPKTKLDNNFLFGNDNASLTIVEAKRVLADYAVPVNSKIDPNVNKEVDGTGLVCVKIQEWVKTVPCYSCGKNVIF